MAKHLLKIENKLGFFLYKNGWIYWYIQNDCCILMIDDYFRKNKLFNYMSRPLFDDEKVLYI